MSDVELERALDFAVRRRESTDWLFAYLGELRCDFAWPHLKVVLHADSLRHHQSPKQMARDAEQRAKLDELGWKQLVVVKPMLKENKWIPHLRRLLGQPVM